MQKELSRLRAEREDLEGQLAKRRRKIIDQEIRTEEDGRLARLLVRTQATMRDYLRVATLRKIDRLSQLVTESFRCLLRKQTLVQRVLIDPDVLNRQFRLHLHRGISYLATPNKVRGIGGLVALAVKERP